jgi:trehalose 6-phosphate synthase/phosphatase
MNPANTSIKRIVVVSYRLPFHIGHSNNKPHLIQNSGGLVSAMLALSEKMHRENKGSLYEKIVWIGKGDHTEEEYENASGADNRYHLVPVEIDEATNDNFYGGFSNNLLWPLFHYFPSSAVFNENYFEAYIKAQQLFLAKLTLVIRPDDLVWIHDYQLLLLPGMLRAQEPESTIGFFLHIPFPSFEIFRMLHRPWQEAILNGMLGADLVGFHINDYAQYFLRAVTRTLGYEVGLNTTTIEGRLVKVDAFPIGIDFDKFSEATKSKKVQNEIKHIKSTLGNQKLIFSVDRLDYTKGFLHRLEGYEYFLESFPQWREKVLFNMVVVPSRDSIGPYQEMKKEIEAMVGRINGKYGTIAWRPIVYQYKSISFDELVALYCHSEVALITPLRDGMNLVCKEFAACQTKTIGVLILSEMAGAAAELGEAILINPTDKREVGNAINKALILPAKERELRMTMIQKRLKNYDVFSWAKDYINNISLVKKQQEIRRVVVMDESIGETILDSYRNSYKRIIFLDYDGTLVPFSRFPELAVPAERTIKLIKNLSEDTRNQVVIISGRIRSFLEEFFGSLNVHLIAEHGAFVKVPNHKWICEVDSDQGWKPAIFPILQRYTNHCNGSFIEEKTTSLAWHYRNAEVDVVSIKAKEMREELREFISNDTRLCMMEGMKVIEVRRAGYDKGYAALRYLKDNGFDFILAIGDDKTDEDLFRVLPPHSFTLKVGLVPSLAKYNLKNQTEVAKFITSLVTSESSDYRSAINSLAVNR